MVLEAVKARAVEYLESKGLAKEDVARVIGIFFFAKYFTFLSMIPVCYRYQPLRRFLRPANLPPKAREYFAARRVVFQQSRAAQQIRSRTKSYQDWLKQQNYKSKAETNLNLLKKQLNQFLHARREQMEDRRRKIFNQAPPNGWKIRLFNFTERMANRAANNERWQKIAQGLHVPPKQLTYAIGEGLVLYKITSPLWMPLELFGIVKFLQWRHRREVGKS